MPGLDAGLLRSGAVEIAPLVAPRARTLTILYGTETGNCRDLARGVAAEAGERGLAATVADMSDYKVRQLKDEQDLLFIVSTYGEGDPPQPSVGFFEFLEGPRAPKLELFAIRCSLLAISTYEKYCEAGKRIDRRLEELGASRIGPGLTATLIMRSRPPSGAQLLPTCWRRIRRVVGGHLCRHRRPGQSRSGPRQAQPVRRNGAREYPHHRPSLDEGHAPCRARSVRLRAPLPAGDSLGLAASNNLQVVEELLDVTGLDGTTEVSVKGSLMLLA